MALEPGSSFAQYFDRRYGKRLSRESYMLKIFTRGNKETLIPADLCCRTRLDPDEKTGGITDQIRAHIERENKGAREQAENDMYARAIAAIQKNGDAERYNLALTAERTQITPDQIKRFDPKQEEILFARNKARHDSAEDFTRLKAPCCTAMDWMLIPAYCFAIQ